MEEEWIISPLLAEYKPSFLSSYLPFSNSPHLRILFIIYEPLSQWSNTSPTQKPLYSSPSSSTHRYLIQHQHALWLTYGSTITLPKNLQRPPCNILIIILHHIISFIQNIKQKHWKSRNYTYASSIIPTIHKLSAIVR